MRVIPEIIKQRVSLRYERWRNEIYKRDNFTCQKCGDSTGGNLNAHHLKGFTKHPELRFNINNGITLCKLCHKKEHHVRGEK
jgi:5-methylcytosine-specific restriction endonuclease McrA